MNDIHARLLDLGLAVPQILLPREGADLSAWAVIACDQFTQDRRYWEQVRRAAGDKASTLNLIYPEVFLEDDPGGRAGRIAAIHRTMARYLKGDVFAPPFSGCVYVERDTPCRRRRRGLVTAVDLDRYDWGSRAKTLIRATEGTLPERLPARMDIRRNAPLESPHILLLVDDEQDSLLGDLAGLVDSAGPAYRGDLMLGSGSVAGWRLDREDQWTFIAGRLEALRNRAPGGFLYAVGDGNHSLAAAKGVWEEYKAAHAGETTENPLRFALVEIENLHDPAISFEPIHRIIFDADMDALLAALAPLPGMKAYPVENAERLLRLVGDRNAPQTRLGLVSGSRCVTLETAVRGLVTADLQPLLDRFAGGRIVDYIHGGEELLRLAGARLPDAGQRPAERRAAGILLPPVRKENLFETVARSGPLPRKSFSMGESVEKRFYLECRSLEF
ncbi:MAG: DUF1015 domain-containing protein [Treponema sp.]|nr:DUF1015 domain-containing protein [Treponema sp.]